MKSTLTAIEAIFAGSDRVALSSMISRFGPDSYLVLIFLLISPNLIPFLCQFGIAEFTSGLVCLLSLQLVLGRETPWLPSRVVNREMPIDKINLIGNRLFPLLYKLDLVTQPRLQALSHAKLSRMYGVMFFILAFLIMMPLPFFNYAPAVVIMISVVGLLSRDGLLLAIGMGLFSVIMVGFAYAMWLMV